MATNRYNQIRAKSALASLYLAWRPFAQDLRAFPAMPDAIEALRMTAANSDPKAVLEALQHLRDMARTNYKFLAPKDRKWWKEYLRYALKYTAELEYQERLKEIEKTL